MFRINRISSLLGCGVAGRARINLSENMTLGGIVCVSVRSAQDNQETGRRGLARAVACHPALRPPQRRQAGLKRRQAGAYRSPQPPPTPGNQQLVDRKEIYTRPPCVGWAVPTNSALTRWAQPTLRPLGYKAPRGGNTVGKLSGSNRKRHRIADRHRKACNRAAKVHTTRKKSC